MDSFFQTVIGFLTLCLASSAMYVQNDILDVELDKQHPIKKSRPLASGNITRKNAYMIFLLLLSSSLIIATILNWQFTIVLVFLFVNTNIYSHWLKNFVYIDLLSISLNFVIRVIAGIIILQVIFSPWLIFGVFLVAFFLGLMKRKGEINTLKESAVLHRKSLAKYSIKQINYLLLVVSILIISTYSLYSILDDPTNNYRLIFTIPIVVIIIFWQYYLSEKTTSPKKLSEVINDKPTIIGILFYTIVTISVLYIL